MDPFIDVSHILSDVEKSVTTLQQLVEVEQAIRAVAPLRFSENLEAFKKYLPDIGRFLDTYQPNALKILATPSGVANVLDPATGVPLYGEDPFADCLAQVEHFIESPHFTDINFPEAEDNPLNFIHTRYLNEMWGMFLEAKDEHAPLTHIPQYIPTVLMFGLGLGYQLGYLYERTKVELLYIVEPDCDLFYASVCCFDWASLLAYIDRESLSININLGGRYEEFTHDFINSLFSNGNYRTSRVALYQHYPSQILSGVIGNLERQYHLTAYGWGFFDDQIMSMSHSHANLMNQRALLLRQPKVNNSWRHVPVFIVGNGPSLDKSLPIIRAYQDSAIIMSCGTAITALHDQGITPDIHFEVERTKSCGDRILQMNDPDYLKQIVFMSVNVMHPGVFDYFKVSMMAMKPGEPSSFAYLAFLDQHREYAYLSFSNPSCANTALAYACYFGFNNIHLFGIDNGYVDPKHHHSKHSTYYIDGKDKEELTKLVVSEGDFKVKGNWHDEVYTTSFMDASRFYMERLLACYQGKLVCYNCGEGAYIDGALPLKSDDVICPPLRRDKSIIVSELLAGYFSVPEYSVELAETISAVEHFDEVCRTFLSQLEGGGDSREELAIMLYGQAKYLSSLGDTKYRHFWYMLDGTVSYVFSILYKMLYGFESEAVSVALTKRGVEVWRRYIEDMRKIYPMVLSSVDNRDHYLVKAF